MKTPSNKSKRFLLIGIFIGLLLASTYLMLTVPHSVKIIYGKLVRTEDGVDISFNIFEPRNDDNDKKVILIGHGVMVNKEMLKGYAVELAAAGFIAVPFDFRGHGQSTGELDPDKLILDAKAVKEYMEKRDDIDKNGFGYIGYSMGGGPGNEIVEQDTDFKCLIGVGTGLPTEEDDLVIKTNSGRELNTLMILARFDQAFDLPSLKNGMGKKLGIDGKDVQVNQLYGSFQEKNASKIFLDDNSDHLTTAWDQDFVREARDWVINTFPSVDPVDENLYVNIRALILIFQVFFGITLFFLLIEPISSLIRGEKENIIFEMQKDNEEEGGEIKEEEFLSYKEIILYSLLLGLPGMFIMIPLLLFPLITAGGLTLLFFGQAFGIIVLLWRKAKNHGSSLKEIIKTPFNISKTNLVRDIILGTVLSTILFLILYVSIGLNYLGIVPALVKIPWIPIYYGVMFFIFLMFEIVTHIRFQNHDSDDLKTIFTNGALSLVMLSLYITLYILIPCIIMNNYFLAIILPLAIPILTLASFISSTLYKKTGSHIPAMIINTFFIVIIIATLSPFTNVMGFLI